MLFLLLTWTSCWTMLFLLLTQASCWTESWVVNDLRDLKSIVTSQYCILQSQHWVVAIPISLNSMNTGQTWDNLWLLWQQDNPGINKQTYYTVSDRYLSCLDHYWYMWRNLSIYWPLWIYFRKHRNIWGFSIICQNWYQIDGLVQERRNSIANALELHLSCTKPLI